MEVVNIWTLLHPCLLLVFALKLDVHLSRKFYVAQRCVYFECVANPHNKHVNERNLALKESYMDVSFDNGNLRLRVVLIANIGRRVLSFWMRA